MNNCIFTGKKTEGEFIVSYKRAGYNAVIPIIDGVPHPELLMSYVSEADRDAGMKMLAEAVKASGGDIPKAMQYMYRAAMSAAMGINPDEAVMIEDKEVILDYQGRKAFYKEEEIANLDDLPADLSETAVKALLVERARNNLPEEYVEEDEFEDDSEGELEDDFDDELEDDFDNETEDEDEEEPMEIPKCSFYLAGFCLLGDKQCNWTKDNPQCNAF